MAVVRGRDEPLSEEEPNEAGESVAEVSCKDALDFCNKMHLGEQAMKCLTGFEDEVISGIVKSQRQEKIMSFFHSL